MEPISDPLRNSAAAPNSTIDLKIAVALVSPFITCRMPDWLKAIRGNKHCCSSIRCPFTDRDSPHLDSWTSVKALQQAASAAVFATARPGYPRRPVDPAQRHLRGHDECADPGCRAIDAPVRGGVFPLPLRARARYPVDCQKRPHLVAPPE